MVRLTEAKTGNRMLVAPDAICVAKENKKERIVELSTMDGFFYEVVDTIDQIESKLLSGKEKPSGEAQERKPQRMRRMRMLPPAIDKPIRKENIGIVLGASKRELDEN